MKLTMCALAILLSVALVSADSRKLLVDDNSSLDNLLQATDFNKIGKSMSPYGVTHDSNQRSQFFQFTVSHIYLTCVHGDSA